MIAYLKGEVLESNEGRLTVAAHGASGVGYAVTVPASPAYAFLAAGRPVELFVHTHVREDALDLYGFLQRAEKDLFLTLLSVSGIGPKGALGLLSKVGAETLIQAIVEGDRAALTRVPGVGKKTAERVVLELGDSLRKKIEAGVFRSWKASAPRGGRPEASQDARAALLGLGYREPEIDALLDRLVEEWDEQALPCRAEDLIRTALRQLA